MNLEQIKATAKMARMLKRLIGRLSRCPNEKNNYGQWQKILSAHQHADKAQLAQVGVSELIPTLCDDCKEFIKKLEREL